MTQETGSRFSLLILACAIFFSIILYDLSYHLGLLFKDFFQFIYVLSYVLGLIFLARATNSNDKIPLGFLFFTFLSIKIYILLLLIFFPENFSTYYLNHESSDAGRYHIPRSINLANNYNYVDFLSNFSEFNGKLTQVVLALGYSVLSYAGLNEIRDLAIFFYFFSLPLTLIIIVNLNKIFSHLHANSSSRAFLLWLFLFNPFFNYYSIIPQKELLLFVGLVLFLRFLFTRELLFLVTSSALFFFERPYFIAFQAFALIFLFRGWLLYKVSFILSMSAFVHVFYGFDRAYYTWVSYRINMFNNTGDVSHLDNSTFSNFLRIVFGPSALRGINTDSNIFYGSYYLLVPFISCLILYASYCSFRKLRFNSILLVGIFTFLILPSHSVMKFTLLTVFILHFYLDRNVRPKASIL